MSLGLSAALFIHTADVLMADFRRLELNKVLNLEVILLSENPYCNLASVFKPAQDLL